MRFATAGARQVLDGISAERRARDADRQLRAEQTESQTRAAELKKTFRDAVDAKAAAVAEVKEIEHRLGGLRSAQVRF